MSSTIEGYFSRLQIPISRCDSRPDIYLLRELHLQHMMCIPFENLNIPLRSHISMEIDALYTKVVEGNRGGFCYELNTLFGHLLESLGYSVRYVEAQVWLTDHYARPRCHMAMLINCDGET